MKTVTGKTKAWLTDYGDPKKLLSNDDNEAISACVFYPGDMSNACWTYVGEATITIELVNEEQVISNKVDALKKSIVHVRADAQVAINDIQNKIDSLLAITYVPESE
jgi:hypothetical protein